MVDVIKKRHFCTYFDKNYLFKGLSLYSSLEKTCDDFMLLVLCLDDDTFEILSKMRNEKMNLLRLADLENYDKGLSMIKHTRSIVEYYWTCTPAFLLYMLEKNKDIDIITYLDADLYFFSNPASIYSEFSDNSILIVPHRFSPEHVEKVSRGIYNVSLLIFRRDENSYECLKWWREKCLNDCSLASPQGTCGDQKYLDEWPTLFEKVVDLQHKGAGLAPWNISQYLLSRKKGKVFVDTDSLIFYHFHQFGIITNNLFEICKGYDFSLKAIFLIYRPYMKEIKESIREVKKATRGFKCGYTKPSTKTFKELINSLIHFRIIPFLKLAFWKYYE